MIDIKMKKVKYLLSIMLVIFCSTILFACGNDIKDLAVSGIETTIAMGHTLVLDEAEVQVKYADGTVEYLEYGDEGLEFVKPDTTTAGEKDLLVKYNGFEKVIKINIVKLHFYSPCRCIYSLLIFIIY